MRWPIPLNSDADLVLSSVFFSLLDSFPFFHTQESGIFLLAVTIPFSFHTQGTSSKVLPSAYTPMLIVQWDYFSSLYGFTFLMFTVSITGPISNTTVPLSFTLSTLYGP